jgi:hypothetical protein
MRLEVPGSCILQPAVSTAKYAKYAKENGVERPKTFTRWVKRASTSIHWGFAWFAFFAVSAVFFKINAKAQGRGDAKAQRNQGIHIPLRLCVSAALR